MLRLTLTHLSFLVLSLSAPVFAQRAPDVRLDTTAPGAARAAAPRIAAVGPVAYVVWEDDRSGANDIYFNRSLDGGATWLSADVRLDTDVPGAAASLSPQIAASGTAVYVTWQDTRNGYVGDIYFNRSLDAGTTWLSSDVRLDTDPPGASPSLRPQIAAVGSMVYVTWPDLRQGLGRGSDIRFNRSLDGGSTWLSADVRLDTDPGAASSYQPQIAASGASVYVTWEDRRTGAGSIHLNRSLDAGSNWLSSDVRLDTDPNNTHSTEPQIAVSRSSVYVTWEDRRNLSGTGDIYLNYSTDAGLTWLSSDVRLDTDPPGAASSRAPRITSLGLTVYVAWQDARNGPTDIYLNRSTDGGVTWLSSDVRLDTDPAGATHSTAPEIAASGSSVYATWEDRRNGLFSGRDIRTNYSTDQGATWLSADVRLDTDPPGAAESFAPQIALGSSVYVIWHDLRHGEDDVYFNIPFGSLPYGPATPGAGGIAPQLLAIGAPLAGATVSIDVQQGLGGATGVLWIGAGPSSMTATPLLGGTQLVHPTVAVPFVLGGSPGVPGAGGHARPISIPNLSTLRGANVNFQAFVLDAGATLGVSMTNAIEMWIG